MRLNTKTKTVHVTHEGAPAARIDAEQALRRSVMSCMLWEREFYEEGEAIADRIASLAAQVDPSTLAAIAIEARHTQHLRHVPLLLLSVLARTGSGSSLVSKTIGRVIARADELCEFLAVHAKRHGVTPDKMKKHISAQMRIGLAQAFQKFDEYQLAKYDRAGAVRLRDVMFLSHPKPRDEAQAALWKRLAESTLETPKTWEVMLSGGADKRQTFEELIRENRLGYLALLRNLRNMEQAGCDRDLVINAIRARRGADRVLPFRYIAAARAAPSFEAAIDEALVAAIGESDPLPGRSIILVDVSGSMGQRLSAKSDLTRLDAACALASVIRSDDLRVFSFSNRVVEVPARRGMAGVDAIRTSQHHGATYLAKAIKEIASTVSADRLIVITDEQSHDPVAKTAPYPNAYMINVASYRNGVGYGGWTHIDGFSEAVIRFIGERERFDRVAF